MSLLRAMDPAGGADPGPRTPLAVPAGCHHWCTAIDGRYPVARDPGTGPLRRG
ncbi:hypothetical protein [Kocuria arenosa]|uniref:hypothetical protein n=1 Tax=Kocuria arenosa TaxID=3071446 RepID=UPI0034D47B62